MVAVRSVSRNGCIPRKPAGLLGLPRVTQIVSETITASVWSRSPVLGNRRFEVLAADLFLELPQKGDVDRDTGLARRQRAEQSSQAWAFVVGRATADVAVAADGQLERVGAPVIAVRGLDVQVVVDE